MVRDTVASAGLGMAALAAWSGGIAPGRGASAADPPAVTRLFPGGAAAGSTVTVRAAGTFPRWPVQVWTDRPSTVWTPLEEAGSFEVTIPAEDGFGVHRVRFHDEAGASAVRRFVVGTDPDMLEAEPNDRSADAQRPAALPVTIHGVLEKAGDVDCFTVDLEAGQTLVASLDAHEGLRSPVDAVLELVDAHAAYLTRNLDARGLDPRIVHTAAATGPVTVRVYGFPADPNQTIGLAGGGDYVYRLTLTTGPAVAATVPAAAAARGATPVEAVGWNLPPAPPRREVTPPSVMDRTWVAFDGVSGVVELPVVEATVAAASDADATDTPPAVTPPVVFGGWFGAPGRRARGRICVTQDVAVVISVEALDRGSEAEALLDIVDPAGTVILSNSTRDATVAWTPPTDGEYTLVLRDRRGAAGPGHFFRLTVVPARPELRATTGADAVVANAAGTVDLPIAVERLRGWQDSVEFFLADPPPGITAAAVTSAAEGETAKQVTLTINATGPWSGPLAIAARRPAAEGEPAQETPVVATVACGSERLPVVWLTVPADETAPPESGQGQSVR